MYHLRRRLCVPLAVIGCVGVPRLAADFPERPIVVVVYTAPGGPIDLMARKFVEIAARHTEAAMVVENQPGAGGLIAVQRVLEAAADGHTLLACTKSNVAKLVATGGEAYLESLHWVAMLMADPECVITRRGAGVQSWPGLLALPDGPQLWVGPATGGLDHVTAVKIWEEFHIEGKWIPFSGGSQAINALLGDQGVAYVGNPREALANPDLQIIAVASPQRLPQFPDVPTFLELGSQRLVHEFMWRGFALKRGTPQAVVAWYDRLFREVTRDPDWQRTWESGGIDVLYEDSPSFTATVDRDRREFDSYLTQFGILTPTDRSQTAGLSGSAQIAALLCAVVILPALLAGWMIRHGRGDRLGEVLIPSVVACLAAVCWVSSTEFPTSDGVGPAAVPRLWIGLMLPLAAWLVYRGFVGTSALPARPRRPDLLRNTVVLLLLYLLALPLVGYVIASAVFLFLGMRVLGVRRVAVLVCVPLGWSLTAYWAFMQQMRIPLPSGRLLEGWL